MFISKPWTLARRLQPPVVVPFSRFYVLKIRFNPEKMHVETLCINVTGGYSVSSDAQLTRNVAAGVAGLSTQEISLESSDIQEQIKQFRRKISMIRDLIEQMDANYQSSKRFMAFQRYRLMKSMIKRIIYNKWIWQHNCSFIRWLGLWPRRRCQQYDTHVSKIGVFTVVYWSWISLEPAGLRQKH